jgi:hypothetical protein
MEEKSIMHRQGDVLFVKVSDLPPELIEHKSDVLVEGEATGHAHRLTEGHVWQTRQGVLFGGAVTGSKMEPGYWQVIRQREYSPEEIRWVRD